MMTPDRKHLVDRGAVVVVLLQTMSCDWNVVLGDNKPPKDYAPHTAFNSQTNR